MPTVSRRLRATWCRESACDASAALASPPVTALSDAPPRDSEPPSSDSARLHAIAIAGVVGVLLLALFFFLYTRSEMWLDEALSVNVARLPLGDLHEALKHDGAPPLYYLLLARLDGNLRHRQRGRAIAVGVVHGRCGRGHVVRGAPVRGHDGRVGCGRDHGDEPVRDPVRDRSAHVRARDAAGRVRHRGIATRARIADPRAAHGVRVARRAVALHPVLGVLSRARRRRAARVRSRGEGRIATRRAAHSLRSRSAWPTFLPWVPTFLYQRAHTGTPWGTPVLPGIPLGYTLRDFAGGASGTTADRQEGWLLFVVAFALLLLGVFARAVDNRRLEVDIRTQPPARAVTFVFAGGLAVALSLNYLAGGAFQSRYSAIVFPFFILLVARGLGLLRDPRDLRRGHHRCGAAGGRRWCAQRCDPAHASRHRRPGAARRSQTRRSRGLLPRPDRAGRAPARTEGTRRGRVSELRGAAACRLGRLQGPPRPREPAGVRRCRARARGHAHALVRQRAGIHHPRRKVRGALRRVCQGPDSAAANALGREDLREAGAAAVCRAGRRAAECAHARC